MRAGDGAFLTIVATDVLQVDRQSRIVLLVLRLHQAIRHLLGLALGMEVPNTEMVGAQLAEACVEIFQSFLLGGRLRFARKDNGIPFRLQRRTNLSFVARERLRARLSTDPKFGSNTDSLSPGQRCLRYPLFVFLHLRKRLWFEGCDIVVIAPDHAFLELPTLRSLYQGILVNRSFHDGGRDISRVEEKQVNGACRTLWRRGDNEVGVKVAQAAATAHFQ